ncbi:hypothetical protein [Thermoactinospora rubra]|uniref:hypothetical protein n=1 Tax=Thermoactinospora rubra TaxID=1088767 RepID=UPI001301ABBA|nr:hypothetical protein [Thermoactinospora rubra]
MTPEEPDLQATDELLTAVSRGEVAGGDPAVRLLAALVADVTETAQRRSSVSMTPSA